MDPFIFWWLVCVGVLVSIAVFMDVLVPLRQKYAEMEAERIRCRNRQQVKATRVVEESRPVGPRRINLD